MSSQTILDTPVCAVVGDDPTLVSREVHSRAVLALAGEDRTLSLCELDPETEVAEISLALRQPGIFAPRMVCVLRLGKQVTAELTEFLESYLADPEPDTTLVLGCVGKLPGKLAKLAKAAGWLVDVSVPTRAGDKRSYVESLLRASPLALDAQARARIATHVGEDVSRIPQILDLLASTYGSDPVGVGDLDGLLGAAGGVPPWDLTDAIDRGDHALALRVLARLRTERAPLQILAILSSHLERMFRVEAAGCTSEAEGALLLGLKGSTFPARKAIDGARAWGRLALEAGVTLVATAGVDLKGGSAWPDDLVLEVLVARLASLRARRR